jgi:polyisoprenyl-teichoic acid--peptidoglycan teichoic acid transferase
VLKQERQKMSDQPTERIPVRQRAKKRPNPIKRFLTTALWILWIGLFGLAGTFLGWIGRSQVAKDVLSNITRPPKEVFKKNALNLLILGCDEDLAPGGQKVLKTAGRADMILMTRIDFDAKTITGISVPRDTRCQLPGGQVHKLNAYHNIAKPEKANALQQQAVEHLTGVKFDRTVVIDYQAFQEMVDVVGGVPVYIKDEMKYTDVAGGLYVDFKPGKKLLDGYDSMCYVRFRKDTGGDHRRTERQREFMVSFKNQVIRNWFMLPDVIEKSVAVLGSSLEPREIGALASFSKGVMQGNIKMNRLPTRPKGNFEVIEERDARRMLREAGFFADSEDSGTVANKNSRTR